MISIDSFALAVPTRVGFELGSAVMNSFDKILKDASHVQVSHLF